MSSCITITVFLETEPYDSWAWVDWPASPRVPPVSIQPWNYPHVLYLGFGWLGLGFVYWCFLVLPLFCMGDGNPTQASMLAYTEASPDLSKETLRPRGIVITTDDWNY